MDPGVKIGLSLSGSPILLVFFILICIGFSIWFYRRTIPDIPVILKSFLVFLRSAALICLVLLIFTPVLRIVYNQIKMPTIGVLIDNSASMNLSDQEIRRSDTVHRLLRSPQLTDLASQTDMHTFLFSNTLIPVRDFPPDSILFSGSSTNIAKALTELSNEIGGFDLQGLFLISDGSHNQGENPVRTGRGIGIPVSSIQIGRPEEQHDLILTRISTNEIVFTDDLVPVEISLRGPGYSGRQISVRLFQETEMVDQKNITIPSDGMETSLKLFFTPVQSGYVTVSAEMSRFEGETTHENNRHGFYTKVLDSKLQVLLLSGVPHPDLSFLNRMLQQDENLSVQCRTQKKDAQFYEGPFLSETELRLIDVLIFLDFPTRSTDQKLWEDIVQNITNRQKPFLIITGKQTDMNRLQTIQMMLPFRIPRRIPDRLVLPRLAQEGSHPILRIEENIQINQNAWHRLPPVFLNWQSPGSSEGSQVLIYGSHENATLPDSDLYPMTFIRDIGGQKTIAVLATGLYRWDLVVRGLGEHPSVLSNFLLNSVRWLSTRDEGKYVQSSTNRQVYSSGETVFLTTHIYDQMYRPLERARVNATLVSPSSTSSFQLIDKGEGKHEYAFQTLESGTYSIFIDAEIEGRSLGRDTTSFSVSTFNPEFLSTRANPELLQNLADKTGGKSGPPDSLSAVINSLIFPPENVQSTREFELFNLPWTLVLLMILLCAEWFVRKRKGML